MRLWKLIRRGSESDKLYDVANSFVICATDMHTARQVASEHCGDEGAYVWLKHTLSSCVCIATTTTAKPGVVVRDYRAG